MGSYFAFNKKQEKLMINKEKYIFEYQDEVGCESCCNIYAYNLVDAEESFKNKYKNCVYLSIISPIGQSNIYCDIMGTPELRKMILENVETKL